MTEKEPKPAPSLLADRRHFIRSALVLSAGTAFSGCTAALGGASGTIDARLRELGIELPPPPAPLANYVAYTVENDTAYIAGQIPMRAGTLLYPGTVPAQVSIEQAREAARQCGINILAALKGACGGDLDRVRRCVRLQGFVASDDDFIAQPSVINAASDLMVEVFGEAGKHTRLALGSNVLPLNACVEISATFALKADSSSTRRRRSASGRYPR